jgi:uroporphyrinogen decarboxylase
MNSRERVITALSHREPDQIPFDLASTPVSGISSVAYNRLMEYMGRKEDNTLFDIVQQIINPSERFLLENGVDTRAVRAKSGKGFEPVHGEDGGYSFFHDEWGIKWRMPKSGGFYYDMASHPLENAVTEADVDAWGGFWDMSDESRYAGMKERAEQIYDAGYAVVVNSASAGMFEMLTWLMGYEASLTNLALEEGAAKRVLERMLEHKLAYWTRVLDEFGDKVTVCQEADDLGTQISLLISPGMYREYIKPLHRELFDLIHRKSDARVFIHSCGAIREILPDFIESGVDIINPVQFNATGMDAAELKREFGRDLVFWGGGVDTQKTLPKGTPKEVEDNVKRMMDILRKDGGFVFNSVHNIQADAPPANLEAYFSTFHRYKKY